MRHRHNRLRLRQKPPHARLLKRNLVTSLFLYESVRTTKKRAEVIRPIVDRLITIVKTKEPMNAIRAINMVVTDKNASRKMMEVMKPRYAKRSSGFTRMTPLGARRGDGAELVTLALLEGEEVVVAKKPAKEKTPKTKKTEKKSVASSTSSAS